MGIFKDQIIYREAQLDLIRQANSNVRALTVDYFLTMLEDQEKLYDLVEDSDYYYLQLDNLGEMPEGYPHIKEDLLFTFYGPVISAGNRFQKSQEHFLHKGQAAALKDNILEDSIRIGNGFLEHTYQIVDSYLVINSTKAVPPKYFPSLNPLQKIKVQKIITELGSEKPENFRETLRRFMPKWIHRPIPAPVDQNWPNYRPDEANWLIHPNKVGEGIPLHMVLKTAQIVEDNGDLDRGYFLRTYGIVHTLDAEREGFTRGEIPYFKHILIGLLAGDQKYFFGGHFFDYQTAIKDTMISTLSRLQDQNSPLATTFMNRLANHYPDIFPAMAARSMINLSTQTQDFNQFAVLRRCQGLDFEWGQNLMDHIYKLPERRFLTTKEIEENAQIFAVTPEKRDEEMIDFIKDVETVIDGEDNYSFIVSLHKLELREGNTKGEIELDLDASSENINAVLRFRKGPNLRFVPFQLSFSGEVESLIVETLDEEALNSEVALSYRDVVTKALKYEADKIRVREQKVSNQAPKAVVVTPEFRTQRLTREQRMELYEQQKQYLSPKTWKRRQLNTSSERDPQIIGDVTKQEAPKRKILGTETERVEKLMNAGKVRDLEAAQVVKRLETAILLADVNGLMFGKKVDTNHISGRDDVRLRQLNWSLHGLEIRIYLQEVGEGEFLLRGILNKKGLDMQFRFIHGLIQQIIREG